MQLGEGGRNGGLLYPTAQQAAVSSLPKFVDNQLGLPPLRLGLTSSCALP